MRRKIIQTVVLALVIISAGLWTGCHNTAKPEKKKTIADLVRRAEQGDADAQLGLALIYDKGEGVPKDLNKAVEWYQKAAEQGLAEAQFNLGAMYYLGSGVPKDRVLAYAWINLASAKKTDIELSKQRDDLETLLTIEERVEAQALSSNWKFGELLSRKGK